MHKKLLPEQIKSIADSLLPGFIPKNPDENEFSFHFTAEGISFKVFYVKDISKKQATYVFSSYEEVESM